MNQRRWNWHLWAGFLLCLVAFASYFLVFARFPFTRDVPWVNFLLFGTGVAFLFVSLKRAFGRKRPCALEPHCWATLLPPDQFSFPSGHTILAVIMTYALRGSRWTLIPAIIVNGLMLVSTVPHGGHHLIDLIVGGAIAACAIFVVRLPLGVRRYRLVKAGAVALASA